MFKILKSPLLLTRSNAVTAVALVFVESYYLGVVHDFGTVPSLQQTEQLVYHVVAWCAGFTTCLLVFLSPRHSMEQTGCGRVVSNCPGAARIMAGGNHPVQCTDSSHRPG